MLLEQFPEYLAPHFRRRGGGIEDVGKTPQGRLKRTRCICKPRKASQRSGSYKIITNIPGVPAIVFVITGELDGSQSLWLKFRVSEETSSTQGRA